jgi:hypothetical protein
LPVVQKPPTSAAGEPPRDTSDRRALKALAVLIAGGVILRLVLMIVQGPGFVGITDSAYYIEAADENIFQLAAFPAAGAWPAGFPLFLKILHALNPNLAFAMLVQHGLGVGAAVLLFLTVRQVAPAVWGLLPAAIVLLAGPQIVLEHAPMPDALLGFLIVAVIYVSVRVLGSSPILWAAAAGSLAAVAACVKVAALPFVAVVAIWLLAATGGGWVRRLTVTGACVAAALVVFGGYLVAMKQTTGFGGPALTRSGHYGAPALPGENQLTRAATQLTAFWSSSDRKEYLRGRGYVEGYGYDGFVYIVTTRTQGYIRAMSKTYPTLSFRKSGLALMKSYERLTRVEGILFVLLVLLAALGTPFARGKRLAVAIFLLAMAVVTVMVPIVFVYFDARYAIVGYGPVAAAAAVGAASLWQRFVAPRVDRSRSASRRLSESLRHPVGPASARRRGRAR